MTHSSATDGIAVEIAASSQILEFRETPEREVSVSGRLITGDGTRLTCTVAGLSGTGARIELFNKASLPASFVLVLLGGVAYPCELVSQDGLSLRARFVNESSG